MLKALNSCADSPCEEILVTVRTAVNLFMKNAGQADDLTMLCLEYKGTE
jgi:sigma-B regulation protein RsbU (phosphoserine phosphatase)